MKEEQGFVEDPRFKQTAKEAVIGIVIFVLNVIWWTAFAYGLGARPPQEYGYTFGFPAWFFWSVIVGYVVISLVVVLAVTFLYKDMPLDADPGDWKMED